jgi:uncharacterized membrane protein YphA (DoxX/SURF4 family)
MAKIQNASFRINKNRKTVRGDNVKRRQSAVTGKVTIAFRLCLGAVFLISSVGKIADPSAFQSIVTNYQLLSPPLVTATAIIFPWMEALCGLALVSGRYDKGAALLTSAMMVVFIGINIYNGYRGLNIACGCFSLSAKTPSNIVVNVLRNMAILGAGIWVLVLPSPREVKSSP